ncbi:MAG: hypothetical protein QF682_09605 [Candidatus Thermoplasmatota archaeon]|jgi:hypothetical protein|nr:hypothetical protein [Candidatus Thermoplasmatota archaeon]
MTTPLQRDRRTSRKRKGRSNKESISIFCLLLLSSLLFTFLSGCVDSGHDFELDTESINIVADENNDLHVI